MNRQLILLINKIFTPQIEEGIKMMMKFQDIVLSLKDKILMMKMNSIIKI